MMIFIEPRALYDRAILGLASRGDGMMAVAYDEAKVIQCVLEQLATDDLVEACEWFDCNIASLGPVFVDLEFDSESLGRL